MRKLCSSTFLAVAMLLAGFALTPSSAGAADFTALQGLTPRQALELANTWRYTRSDMDKMFVDSQNIVFIAKDKSEKVVALPEDEMVIAIAPYVKKTHT